MRRIILSVARVISGFRREVQNIRAALGYYRAYSGNSLPTFRDNLSVSSSWVKDPTSLFRNVCRELLLRSIRCVIYQKSADLISGLYGSTHYIINGTISEEEVLNLKCVF
jgi:hypothetical protein